MVVLVVILALAAGAFYAEFTRLGSVPAPKFFEGVELDQVAQRPMAPNTSINGPFVETSAAPASFDDSLASLPQVGPAEKVPMREMLSPNGGEPATDGAGPDAVLQTDNSINAMPGLGISFAELDFQNSGRGLRTPTAT
jgi:hypothetical protein